MLTKILIADSSEEFRLSLTEALRPNCAVHTCADGLQALELLRTWQPDFLVMDLALSGMDGLSVLQSAKAEGICPRVLVTASLLGDYVINALRQYDVVYMVLKPCLISVIAARIDDLICQYKPPLFFRPSPESVVSTALMELGMNASRGGYHYCIEAILMLAENPSLQVTKAVYPVIGKPRNSEGSSVEKSIRDAIFAAYANGKDEVWQRYFPAGPDGRVPRPSNRVFLSTLAEVLFSVNAAAQ